MCILAALVLLLALPALAAEPERVRFPGRHQDKAVLDGYLFRAAGEGARPTLVMMHGCGGLWTKSGRMAARERFWGDRLALSGMHALLVDSFAPRGIDELCTKSVRALSPIRDRPYDAYGALAFLQATAGVDPARIGLFGWSNGAMATLASLERSRPERGFRFGIAFYPGCSLDGAYKQSGWAAAVPILLLLGAADDWTPAALCHDLAAKAAGKGAEVTVKAYAGAYHGFDQPTGTVHTREVRHPSWGNKARTVHVGPDPAGRAAARDDVTAFLQVQLERN